MEQKKEGSRMGYLMRISARGGAWIVVVVAMSVVAGVLAVVPFYALYKLIAELLSASPQSAELARWGVFVLVSGLALMFFTIASGVASHVAAFTVLRDLRYALASKMLELPLGWFSKRTSGDTCKLFTEDVEKIELFIAHHIPDLVRAVVTPATMLAFLFWADWRLALASMVPLLLAPLALARVYSNFNEKMADYYALTGKMNGTIVEYIRGMSVVRAFNRTAASFGDYKSSVDKYYGFWKGWSLGVIKPYGLFMTALESGSLFILGIGGPLYLAGQVSLPAFLVALILGPAYVSSIKQLYFMTSHMTMNLQGVTRLRAVLESEPLPEPAVPESPRGEGISFSSVDFAYGDENAVSGLSFEAAPGTITALVGPSGAGKTTAALLAARFYDPASGVVRFGGVPYPKVGTKELMRRVSICFQDSQLFAGTIEDNIRMGNRTASAAAVEKAARAARAHEFIEKLPQGYRTVVTGDRTLSGGQIQRLAIARAILKDSPVLILDEATSYADPENERLIQEALNELLADKTVIVVAHRLATLKHVDRILVFEKGRVAESGTWDELVGAGGTFSRLWEGAGSALEWGVRDAVAAAAPAGGAE